jgi:hypothetical protein
MPPIPIKALRVTKQAPPIAKGGKVTLHSMGKVTSVGEHYGGRHAEITVVHGKKPPAQKPKKGDMAMPSYDDRASSHFVVSKKHAKHFPVGGRVKISMTPMQDGDDQDGAMDDPDEESGE